MVEEIALSANLQKQAVENILSKINDISERSGEQDGAPHHFGAKPGQQLITGFKLAA